MTMLFWAAVPSRRDRRLYLTRCLTRWHYMRQTRPLYRIVCWWMNR